MFWGWLGRTAVPDRPCVYRVDALLLQGVGPEDTQRCQSVAGGVEPTSDRLPCEGPAPFYKGPEAQVHLCGQWKTPEAACTSACADDREIVAHHPSGVEERAEGQQGSESGAAAGGLSEL